MSESNPNNRMPNVISRAVNVVCCHCNNEIPVDSLHGVIEWHGKPCPECGAPNIIDDFDKESAIAMLALIALLNSIPFEQIPEGDVEEKGTVIRVSTKDLKQGLDDGIRVVKGGAL